MPMNSSPDWPAELDAGQPLERILLVSPASTAVQRELLVYRDGEIGRMLRIVEIISSGSGAQPSRENTIRFLDLTQDAVIPLYTIASQPRAEWNMEVIYGGGSSPVVYSLRGREDIFRLQRLFTTGYKPAEYFENVTCSVIFKSKIIRHSQHKGCGEIQLWRSEMEPSSPMPPMSPTSSRSSRYGISTQSTYPKSVGPMGAVSIQTDYNKGEQSLLSDRTSPPLLVAFLQDDPLRNPLLTSLVTNLGYTASQDGQINLQDTKARTFIVNRLSVEKRKLNSWNLCAIGTKTSRLDSLKCTYLTLKFGDSVKLEDFEKKLLLLQGCWLSSEVNRLKSTSLLRSGKMPLSSTSTVTGRKASLASTFTGAQPSRTPSLPPLPIHNTEPLGTGLLPELGIEQPTRELDGGPDVGPFELNDRDNREERRDRTYWRYR
ncbi:MAG: hypothetical protein M1813_006319 [Trichoglossum hirsutum]|nr:MAG: hypothetical protein M1813_006319 [Trichoglossum hirsutum]